jgi:hypothetical protein
MAFKRSGVRLPLAPPSLIGGGFTKLGIVYGRDANVLEKLISGSNLNLVLSIR